MQRLEKIRRISSALEPYEDHTVYPLGSYQGKRQRLRSINIALSTFPKPQLDDLDDEQLEAMECAVEGMSIYVTGAAGTGKTLLFTRIAEALRYKHSYLPAVALTASTGMAASRFKGQTLHSWAGFHNFHMSTNTALSKVERFSSTVDRWMSVEALMVDEVSMIDGRYLDLLDAIARRLKGNDRPYGGIQLITSGDFFQLPPVEHQSNQSTILPFQSAAWVAATQRYINLKVVHRQTDPEFIRVLNECRVGSLSNDSLQMLRSLARGLDFFWPVPCLPVELYPRRATVDQVNHARLMMLEGTEMQYEAQDGPWSLESQPHYADMPVDALVRLKIGAQVMLRKNLGQGLFNGSIGTVLGFHIAEHLLPLERKDVSLDYCIRSIDVSRIPVHSSFTLGSYPLVKFESGNGVEYVLCQPEPFRIEDHRGQIVAIRNQVPLSLAWSMTIHKSQGQTIPKLSVDFDGMFTPGQAYVALSRASSTEGLQVVNFCPLLIMADPRVIAWHLQTFNEL